MFFPERSVPYAINFFILGWKKSYQFQMDKWINGFEFLS